MAKILIVDDDMEFIVMLKKRFKAAGIDAICINSGKEGLAALKKVKGIELLILDLLMPEMSGWVFLNEMSKLKIQNIPIIVLTNLSNTSIPDDLPKNMELVVKANISMKELVEKSVNKLKSTN